MSKTNKIVASIRRDDKKLYIAFSASSFGDRTGSEWDATDEIRDAIIALSPVPQCALSCGDTSCDTKAFADYVYPAMRITGDICNCRDCDDDKVLYGVKTKINGLLSNLKRQLKAAKILANNF